MALPADFPRLSVPEQLFVAVDRERVDRGLAPFTGLTAALNADAQKGAETAAAPARAGPGLSTRWRRSGSAMSTTGSMPTSSGCTTTARTAACPGAPGTRPRAAGPTGTWSSVASDRRDLVMGAAYDPTGDTSSEDRGGSSLAATLATSTTRGTYAYTWKQALTAMAAGTAAAAAGDPLLGVRHRNQ